MIQHDLHRALQRVNTMGEIQQVVLGVLEVARREADRLGYVAGIISSDGPEKIPENCRTLIRATETLRAEHDFPMFSSQDVFTPELYARIQPQGFAETDFQSLWSNVLESNLITDVFFTPRWEGSVGARQEYEIARRLGLRIVLP